MKIFSISRIKNEMDIIESFIRYNMNITDGMIILDNNSNDKTTQILSSLMDEYENLYVYNNTFNEHHNIELEINYLLDLAVKEYDADMIIPLDADEFIVSSDGNPRKIIEKLSNNENSYYSYYWKTYLPIYDDFKLSNLKYIRSNSLEDHQKIILPSKLVKNNNIRISPGSHTINHNNPNIKNETIPSLRLAHIPIRSKQQCISKICNGWLNNRTKLTYDSRNSWHQKKIFDMLIENNLELTDEQLIDIAIGFSSKITYDNKDNLIEESIFDTSFCEDLSLKYTDNNVNAYSNILSNMEQLCIKYSNLENTHKNILTKQANDTIDEEYTLHKYINLLENTNLLLENQLSKNNTLQQEKENNLKTKIINLNKKIKEYDETINAKNKKILEYESVINQKNDKLSLYEQTIHKKNDKINAYIKTVEKREKIIENLENQLNKTS